MYISFFLCYNSICMEAGNQNSWRRNCQVFEERAEEYDSWFEHSLLFDIELAAIRKLAVSLPRPWVEIGVGPGRFAARLGTEFGIDPAPAALRIAAGRGITPIAGIGEQLPLADASMGTLSMLFTLCFLTSPETALAECFRVLRSKGILLLGFIPAHSRWGRSLAAKRDKQHPYYRYTRCRTVAETRQLLDQAGFFILRGYSTLYQNPEAVSSFEEPQSGLDEKAGFCVLTATRRKS